MAIKPSNRPQLSKGAVAQLLKDNSVEDQVALVGVRSYFRNSMGKVGANDRRLYDDAIFLVTPTEFMACNANTDPNGWRPGHGKAEATMGIASLKAGVWPFVEGLHKGEYRALRQGGFFTLLRDADDTVPADKIIMLDGVKCYEDVTDSSGINIHHGSDTSTSSLGCQTIYPEQWEAFIALVYDQLKLYKQTGIKYLLLENDGSIA